MKMEKIDIIEKAKAEKRTALTEAEAKKVLKKYGIPVVEEKSVKTIRGNRDRSEKNWLSCCFKRVGFSSYT